MRNIKLAFCVIVKDDSEAQKLRNLLITVIDHVDSIHITSNGEKTDDIEALVAFTRGKYSQKQIDYTHLPWNEDFSEQRNYNFSRVPSDTDYIVWADSDDLFVGAEHLKKIALQAKKNKKDVVFLKYWYGCEFDGEPSLETFKNVDIEHYRERLIRPGTITWKGRLHETPVPVAGQKDSYTKVKYSKEHPIAVMHTALIGDSLEKMQRNRRILELQLKEEREKGEADPRTLLYLMKIYTEVGDTELLRKCIGMGHEYLKKSGWDEERANANDLMAICSVKLGDNHEAIKYLHKAIEEYPHQPLHYIRLSLAYFNVGRYRESKHWLEIAGQLDLDDKTAGINNIKEMKVLFAQMLLKIKYNVDKDLPGAVEAAEALLKEQPNKENEQNLAFMLDLLDLYEASESAKQLLEYLESIGSREVLRVLDGLPDQMKEQPWAVAVRNRNTKARVWKDNEICYFANFGGKHFEKWDANSLKSGIGGSETAVIKLSEAWAKQGYKVTVYGDPQKPCEINGVTYLPYYYFNKSDKFSTFIQWRSAFLAPTIKAKKFLVDLHDVVHQVDYSEEIINAVDKIMVKSQYHREFLPNVPDEKIEIVGNGIVL